MNEKPREGWGHPLIGRKWHYFVGGISLCGRYRYMGELEQGNDTSPDNCVTCARRMLKARAEREARP